MSVRGDTVVLFGSVGKLYMCLVYTWWDSFEIAPVTGSLLSVTPYRLFAEFCDLFLHVVDSFARDLREIPYTSEMATGSGRPPLDRSGVDFKVKNLTFHGMPQRRLSTYNQRGYTS